MRDDRFEDFLVDQLLGQVVVDFLVRQEATRLAHLDERLELLAALGGFLFGQRGLFQAELTHQRALLGAADLHAQRLGLGFLLVDNDGFDLRFEFGFDVGPGPLLPRPGPRPSSGLRPSCRPWTWAPACWLAWRPPCPWARVLPRPWCRV
jgi:hypothetical protein